MAEKRRVERREFAQHDNSNLRYIRKVETRLVEDGNFEYRGGKLEDARTLAHVFRKLIHFDREQAVVLFLDRNDMPIGYDIWTGGIDFVVIDPRQIFKQMALLNASKVVFCHNHPEGEARPSQGDQMFCIQMCQLCRVMGWVVKDFIVLGRRRSAGGSREVAFYSFEQENDPALLRPERGPESILR